MTQVKLKRVLQADLYRLLGREVGVARILIAAALYRNYRVFLTLRICQYVASRKAYSIVLLPLCKIVHRLVTSSAGMDLPWNAKIAEGCAITHGWGLVISAGAVIGRNVTIFHGVTLGRSDRIVDGGERVSGYPTIEDDVWIGPHAVIVGPITVGRGSRITAGAVVLSDVAPYSMISGNPGVLKKSDCRPDVMNRVDF